MPNHVTTTCTVTGSPADIQRFAAAHFHDREGAYQFDFNTIIPMPERLRDSKKSSGASLGFFALTGRLIPPVYRSATSPLEYEWVRAMGITDVSGLREFLERERPTDIEAGKAAAANLEETGFTDWHVWTLACWGTKWNAYNCKRGSAEPGRLVFRFDTAWSFPEPVFRKLAEIYVDLVFSIASYEEGQNFACDGSFNGAGDFREVECTRELSKRAYGES